MKLKFGSPDYDGVQFSVDEDTELVQVTIDPNKVKLDVDKDNLVVFYIPYKTMRDSVLAKLRQREMQVLSEMSLDDYADIITREY